MLYYWFNLVIFDILIIRFKVYKIILLKVIVKYDFLYLCFVLIDGLYNFSYGGNLFVGFEEYF